MKTTLYLNDCNWTQIHSHLVRKRTLNHLAKLETSDFAPASSKEFLDIQATIECGFTLKRIHDLTRTYRPTTCSCTNQEFFS